MIKGRIMNTSFYSVEGKHPMDKLFAPCLAAFACGIIVGALTTLALVSVVAPIVVKVPVNAIPLQKVGEDMTEACTAWWTGSSDLTAVRSRLCGVKK
jgi:hypothetical protein